VLNLQRTAGNSAVARSRSQGGRRGDLAVQRARYGPGTYGYRADERALLEDRYGAPIDGNSTHQSEHIHGFSAVTSLSGVRRGQSGPAGADIRDTENRLPAYYETHRAHRDHIGTGSRTHRDDASGMTSREYRDAQYYAASHNDPFTGAALNQSAYANQPSWRSQAGTVAGRQADDSFGRMVGSGAPVTYYTGPDDRRETRPLARNEQADLVGYRRAARDGRYLSQREQEEILGEYGGHTHQLRSMGRPARREPPSYYRY
jgi:hypothetical protein